MVSSNKFRWRSKSIPENVWTSAVFSLFAAIAIAMMGEVIIGDRFKELISEDYPWTVLLALFLFFFLARMPKKKTSDRKKDIHEKSGSE